MNSSVRSGFEMSPHFVDCESSSHFLIYQFSSVHQPCCPCSTPRCPRRRRPPPPPPGLDSSKTFLFINSSVRSVLRAPTGRLLLRIDEIFILKQEFNSN